MSLKILTDCRNILFNRNKELLKAISSSDIHSFWQQFNLIRKKKSECSPLNGEIEKLQRFLDRVILDIRNTPPIANEKSLHSNKLDDLLEQSRGKRENLARHWAQICSNLRLNKDIDLHGFLQYILKYNSLLIHAQQLNDINTQLKEYSEIFEELKGLLREWYELTGSQKEARLENYQLVISEAQNIIRYLAEKEKKKQLIENYQIEIEVNRSLKQLLTLKVKTLEESWQSIIQKFGIQENVKLGDPRLKPLLEKCQIVGSLSYLQNHIASSKTFPAFTKNWNYEYLCIWRLALTDISLHGKKQLIENLKDLPSGAKHILYVTDKRWILPLKEAGLGQIDVSRGPLTQTQNPFLEKDPTPGIKITQDEPSMEKIPEKPIKQRPSTQDSAPVSKRVQAVIDLLNGH